MLIALQALDQPWDIRVSLVSMDNTFPGGYSAYPYPYYHRMSGYPWYPRPMTIRGPWTIGYPCYNWDDPRNLR